MRRIGGLLLLAFMAIVATRPTDLVSGAAFSAETSTGVAAAYGGPTVLMTSDWWLDASALDTLYSDTACATPASSAAGSTVNCWADRRVPNQAVVTSVLGPASVGSPIGERRPLRFTNTSRLAGPDIFAGSVNEISIFLVTRVNDWASNFIVSLNGTSTSASSRFSLHFLWPYNKYVYFDAGGCCTTNRSHSQGAAMELGETVLFAGWKDIPGVGKNGFRINGGTERTSPGGTVASTTGGLSVGNNFSLVDHDIAELIIFEKVLTATERADVEQYLATKWDLTLS